MHEIIIRQAMPTDHGRCCEVEGICFPADEAAGPDSIRVRINEFPQGFLVAEAMGDGQGPSVIGHVNCGCTSKPDLADEEFKQLIGHDPDGANMVIFSLSVLPEFRRHGVGARLMEAFIERSRSMDKEAVLLLCKPPLVPYYARFGFEDRGLSPSTHGGAAWHEMRLGL